MSWVYNIILGFLLFSESSRAGISFYALRDAYNTDPANPQLYRFDDVSNFRSGTQASISTRVTSQGFSSDIAIDEQGRFYLVNGNPTSTTDSKEIWRWNNVADWASNTGATRLGIRTGTALISGFSVYQNEFYFFEGDPNNSGNKTLRKWASVSDWASGSTGTLLGTRGTGPGLGFEIDNGGAVWYLDGSTQTSTSGTLYRWNSINDFLNNTNGSINGGSFTFSFSGSPDQISGLAVPEPSALSLLAVGLGGLAMLRRRRS